MIRREIKESKRERERERERERDRDRERERERERESHELVYTKKWRELVYTNYYLVYYYTKVNNLLRYCSVSKKVNTLIKSKIQSNEMNLTSSSENLVKFTELKTPWIIIYQDKFIQNVFKVFIFHLVWLRSGFIDIDANVN